MYIVYKYISEQLICTIYIRTTYMHWFTSSPQTLPNTANNRIKQITKEKTFQLYQCCANNFLKKFFC